MPKYEWYFGNNDHDFCNAYGYAFVNTDSKTQAGGVGLYLSNDLEFSRRSDLDNSDDGIESCWIELARITQKNIVIGCVFSKD